MSTDFWKEMIFSSLEEKPLDISIATLLAVMFKKKIKAIEASNLVEEQGWELLNKCGVGRQNEFLKHIYFPLDIHAKFTIGDIFGDNTEAKKHILSYITDSEQ